jgi:hypothetical protein
MYCCVFWKKSAVVWEERITFVFRVEEYAKQEMYKKQAFDFPPASAGYLLSLLFDTGGGGNTLLQERRERLHRITPQEMVLFIAIAARTWSSIKNELHVHQKLLHL